MTKKISVKTFYLFGVIVLSLVFLAARSTYAMFTASVTINNPITITSNLSYNSELIEYQTLTIVSGEEKDLQLVITDRTGSTFTPYASWYTCLSGESACQNLVIGATSSGDPPSGNIAISGGSSTTATKRVNVKVRNDGDSNINIRIGAVGISTGNSVVLSDEMILIPENYSTRALKKVVVYKVDIVRKLTKNDSTSSSLLAETVNVDAGDNSQKITVTGSSDFPNYKGTICTNDQSFSENILTDTTSMISTVEITLENVSSDAVCTVEFEEAIE